LGEEVGENWEINNAGGYPSTIAGIEPPWSRKHESQVESKIPFVRWKYID